MAGLLLNSGTPSLFSLVQNLTFEGTGAVGLFTEQQLKDFINLAHRELYSKVAEASPSWFAKRSADLSITSSGLDISGTSSVDSQTVHILQFVEYKDGAGKYYTLDALDRSEIRAPAGPYLTTADADTFAGWTIEGQKLYLYPEPSGTKTVRLNYVPGIADLSATTDAPFSGNLAMYHDTVAYLAALLALEKDSAATKLKPRYEERLRQMLDHVRRRHGSTSRQVRRIRGEW